MKRFLIIGLAIIVGGIALVLWLSRSDTEAAAAPEADLIPLLQDSGETGYALATEPDAVTFPIDLGAHPDYQTEWWYYTGNLQTAEGRDFGFQLTFFRRALTPDEVAAEQAATGEAAENTWQTRQVYLAHFTISDVAEAAFYPAERFSRGAAGLAGAQAEPYYVWLENWYAQEQPDGRVRLFAETGEVMLDLMLSQTMDPVLHGVGGLSQKGPEMGNATYYYSFVQQPVMGTIRVGETIHDVTGQAWKDHEWSTSALSDDAVGWDWFSLQLDNGGALMFFEIRNADGGLEPFSSGTYIAPDGSLIPLARGDWTMAVQDTWRSEVTDIEYPVAWDITIPQLDLVLSGRALMPNQELTVSTIYWEGAVGYTGSLAGDPLTAIGYVEMTGYGPEGIGLVRE
jgi:predicted secreted hydrolase